MTRMLAATVLALVIFTPRPAAAAEWRYCLATSHDEPVIYMTGPFATTAETTAVEAEFAEALNGARYSHDDVQCPRADDKASLVAMQQYATSFNVKDGNKVIRLRWTPNR